MYNFREKYLKYKSKYLTLLKKIDYFENIQDGGDLEIANIDLSNLSEKLMEINNNLGQNNCGIIFIDKYVIKCIGIYNNNDINIEKYLNELIFIKKIDLFKFFLLSV